MDPLRRRYAKCQQYLDHPQTCTSYWPDGRTEEEHAENARCQELGQQSYERASVRSGDEGCWEQPWHYVDNPEGFDFPVNIQFGTTWMDWLNPRYRP